MRVEQLGEGDAKVAVLGGVHGDEPCGVHAIETLLEEEPRVERPVKFVIANEEALAQGVRFIEDDLNRVFPGAPDAESHERRLAHEVLEELGDCLTFSMHSTQSYDRPFAVIADENDPVAEAIVPYLSVDAAVDTSDFAEGRFIDFADVVEVECGLQGSQTAAENAVTLTREFLAAVGALPEERREPREVRVFRLKQLIPKEPAERYDVLVENFERVATGTPYASADEHQLVAEEPFYPVLLSPYGYQKQFGYAADLIGTLGTLG